MDYADQPLLSPVEQPRGMMLQGEEVVRVMGRSGSVARWQ
jgi:hypothetical protein